MTQVYPSMMSTDTFSRVSDPIQGQIKRGLKHIGAGTEEDKPRADKARCGMGQVSWRLTNRGCQPGIGSLACWLSEGSKEPRAALMS